MKILDENEKISIIGAGSNTLITEDVYDGVIIKLGKNFNRMKDIDLHNFNFSHVLVDPPRSGLSDDVINLISEFSNIIYVSCNPKTYIEDIKKLKKHNINKIEIFDQFPNTNHMELVSLLTSN